MPKKEKENTWTRAKKKRRRCSSSTTDSLYCVDTDTNGKHNCKERLLNTFPNNAQVFWETRTPGLVKLLRAYRKEVRTPKPIPLQERSTIVLCEETQCAVSLQNYLKKLLARVLNCTQTGSSAPRVEGALVLSVFVPDADASMRSGACAHAYLQLNSDSEKFKFQLHSLSVSK